MNITKIVVVVVFILSGFAGFAISLWHHRQMEVDEVQTITTFHYPAIFAKQLIGDKRAGEKIFGQFCTSCHGVNPIVDVPAPHIGDKAAWSVRRKMGMKNLMLITTDGIGAMPARGGCFECSDAQLQQTVEYILQQSR